eukprot:s1891_g9.t1
MATSKLAERLQAVTTQKANVEYMKMSYDQLAKQRIAFGEAKLNQRFEDVIQQDPKYVAWFVRKYENSQKPAHKAFIYFINLFVERQEIHLEAEPLAQPSKLELKAKAKARPSDGAHQEIPETLSEGSWSEEESKPWSVVQEEQSVMMREEILQQNGRIENVETTLQQITHQLQALTQVIMTQGNVPKP